MAQFLVPIYRCHNLHEKRSRWVGNAAAPILISLRMYIHMRNPIRAVNTPPPLPLPAKLRPTRGLFTSRLCSVPTTFIPSGGDSIRSFSIRIKTSHNPFSLLHYSFLVVCCAFKPLLPDCYYLIYSPPTPSIVQIMATTTPQQGSRLAGKVAIVTGTYINVPKEPTYISLYT